MVDQRSQNPNSHLLPRAYTSRVMTREDGPRSALPLKREWGDRPLPQRWESALRLASRSAYF